MPKKVASHFESFIDQSDIEWVCYSDTLTLISPGRSPSKKRARILSGEKWRRQQGAAMKTSNRSSSNLLHRYQSDAE